MPTASYPTKTASIHGFGGVGWAALALLALLAGCGDDDGNTPAPIPTPNDDAGMQDGGGEDPFLDATIPPPPPLELPDAGRVPPGDPPAELMDAPCAVDTNKLYELSSFEAGPRPTQLAVDLVASTFGVGYVGPSEECFDAVFLTQLSGASGLGEPETLLVSDECTMVEHASVFHTGDSWVFAIADGRYGATEISTVVVDEDGPQPATRITESDSRELETIITKAGEGLLMGWVDIDVLSGEYTLRVRLLDARGAPVGDEVVLGDAEGDRYGGLAMQIIGERFVGFGYRRASADGSSAIILEILDVTTGERDRDAQVLADAAGSAGGIDFGTDVNGGAVMYSVGEGTSQQLWLQLLAPTGQPAEINAGLGVGATATPQRIVGPPIDATDASLTKLVAGYAVSYRVLPRDRDLNDDEPAPQPRIHVYFVNNNGQEIGDSDIALALPYGGRTAIESAYDGRMVVAWSDTADDGVTTLTAVKLPCVGGN